ncbi:MAG: TA system VapC family ribonuclease toxin [Xanthomonadales bacterium]|nr:PIN domain-containing protein [Pseudoxanthomonas sp.]MDZ3799673.1 TA system VapC family ribonuclease toxin [Xanthomonadales bacterium]
MRALLDINVLIALLDGGHSHHPQALAWFLANAGSGWASCPLTQNGCVRILSQPGYARPLPLLAVADRLRTFTASPAHQFWPDDLSMLDTQILRLDRIHGPAQITDAYLLALAVAHGGRFATFDERIATATVPGATAAHLVRV